ncbi:quinone-dependent dihydroorotate dehydrogenase [Ornithinimicrobium pekingense]|uniref:Dihydroorotate dehydrogenase (quinone) n=1 Tax=Ornithinimicrobium pekingense TaxID=384677 RepID=A0ABQ2F6V8_9MICO|nr:quinone-dependent dihydroorotate dehydrogenase [Ornithinimicrobium pekingense]GGK64910.1 dihydroorotate dehydrogenase (quinone) [Ornithinimicrobium pekingense]
MASSPDALTSANTAGTRLRRAAREAAGTAYADVAAPLLWRLDAETAHHGAVVAAQLLGARSPGRALAVLGGYAVGPVDGPREPVELLGLRFPHRIGLAAGMDKDGRGVATWGALGLGHVELGTVTARPQPGNPRPRLFRLPESRAVVNRMGFNNQGVHALAARLRLAREQGLVRIPVGVSIGKSKVTPVEEAVGDYLESVAALEGLADYLAVNVSSPNTPGLRSLQDAGPLTELLDAVVAAAGATPVLVKLAPDLTDDALDEALEVALAAGAGGVIATNTTLSREGVAPRERTRADAEAGGLSGAPLTLRAREVVAHVASRTDLPVIGVGGVMSGADARALVDAGASLVQLWTGLVYAGPTLVADAVEATAAGVGRGRSSPAREQ